MVAMRKIEMMMMVCSNTCTQTDATTFQSEPMNLAYTSATLGLHLDLPFYEYTPGVQVLPLNSFDIYVAHISK